MADDLHENLVAADKAATQMKKGIDKFSEKAGIDARPRPWASLGGPLMAQVLYWRKSRRVVRR